MERWLDCLVRRVDRRFDGDVDHNNHRYLADSVLMAWDAAIGDSTLYAKGIARLRTAFEQMRGDGSLPLETRSGARALWYTRQAMASFVVMAEIAALKGDDLYALSVGGRSIDTGLHFFLSAVHSPLLVTPYAVENYIPGPSEDWTRQDLSMLHTRPHGCHYLAWDEAYVARRGTTITGESLAALLDRHGVPAERPLIDEYSGGNGTCFWMPTVH